MGSIPAVLVEPLSVVLGKIFTTADLEELVLAATGDGLFEVWVGEGMPLRKTIFELLEGTSRQGIADLILGEMLARRPQSAPLRDLIAQALPAVLTRAPRQDFRLSAQRGGHPIAGLPDDAYAPGLRGNVAPRLTKIGVSQWGDRLAIVQRRVCRIDADSAPRGTGFLVGPQAVLTSYHCVQDLHHDLARVTCRFDFQIQKDGATDESFVVPLAADGMAAWEPVPVRIGDRATPVPPNELDFALLRLAEPIGRRPINGVERGWLSLPSGPAQVQPDDALLIVQHSGGGPMVMVMDLQSIIGPNSNGTRVWHRSNTAAGSSGAACLNMDLEPVLMHQYGTVDVSNNSKINAGVPLGLIRDRIMNAAALIGE